LAGDNSAEGDPVESAEGDFAQSVASEATIIGEVTFLHLAVVAKAWSTRVLHLPAFLTVMVQ
jgi:hypothetical protein